jgi:hypothetical protein
MRQDFLKNMLLIEEASVFTLYKEMMDIASFLVVPMFLIALLFEYLMDYQFPEVIKKLFIITLFAGSFYQFHTQAVDLSLRSASETLARVSPDNIFQKRWTETRVKTKHEGQSTWGWAKSFFVPNVNELIGTALFVIAQILLWILKLIYSTVYHLTYVFSGITAVLYFLGWTKDALKGTVRASIWCILQPYVVVALLALVGNSVSENIEAAGIAASSIDNLIWLFGITFLLLASPMMTYGMVQGDGIHSFGSKVGALSAMGAKKMMIYPALASHFMANSYSRINRGAQAGSRVFQGAQKSFSEIKSSLANNKRSSQSTNNPMTKFLSEKSINGNQGIANKVTSHQKNAEAITKKYLPNRPMQPSEIASKYTTPNSLKQAPENLTTKLQRKDTTLMASRYLSPEIMNKSAPKTKPAAAAAAPTRTPVTANTKSQIRPRRKTNELC